MRDLGVVVPDDRVPPSQQPLDLRTTQEILHGDIEGGAVEAPETGQQLARAAVREVLRSPDLLENLEGPRVVDHPDPPIPVDQKVAEVAVEVVDQLVEDADHEHLVIPGGGVGRLDLLLQARALVHQHVLHPPHKGRIAALVAPHHRHGRHAQPENTVEAVGGHVVPIAVAKVDLGSAVKVLLLTLLVDPLDMSVVLEALPAQGGALGVGDAAGGRAPAHDLGLEQEALFIGVAEGALSGARGCAAS